MASSSSSDSYEEWESPSESTEPSSSSDDESSDPSSSLRENGLKRKRRASQEKYFQGRARHPYSLRQRLDESFKDTDEGSPSMDGVCSHCTPALAKIAEGFRRLKHQGSELNKRKHSYPSPKVPRREHYRNLVAQNEWLRGNIYDSMGNYLFCHRCVQKALHISKQRLSRQRMIKRNQFQQSEVKKTKREVESEKLCPFVVMPEEIEISFSKWWSTVPDDHEVNIRYPFERHGLAGKPSNNAKTATKEKFLVFVDNNSQPNGRHVDSHNPTHYFLPTFTTITIPKEGIRDYESRLQTSVVAVFNRLQRECGEPTISNFSACSWLKAERPKLAIYPHKLDYCDFCAHIKCKVQEKQTTINRKKQSGSVESGELELLEKEKEELSDSLRDHKQVARESLQYYKSMKEKCAEQWQTIAELQKKSPRTDAEQEKLEELQHCYTLLLSADYQMQKLVPHWGQSPQPSSTYYLQKLSFDLFGIVDHRDESASIYIFDERVGHKTADHTISYLLHYLKSSGKVPNWISRVHIFLDNAGSTNKNQYLMSSCMELVQQKVLNYFRVSFMVPGHTKFAPDLLFSRIASAYHKSDVFNEADLELAAMSYATVCVDHGRIVRTWREKVGEKYTNLPGIRELHDFICVAMSPNGVLMKVRQKCYIGVLKDTPTKVKKGFLPSDSCIPKVSDTYESKKMLRPLTDKKMEDLKQMFEKFIEVERWPDFLRSD